MHRTAARPERQLVITAAVTNRPATHRTTGTLAVAFVLLRTLLSDEPLKRPKRRRPEN